MSGLGTAGYFTTESRRSRRGKIAKKTNRSLCVFSSSLSLRAEGRAPVVNYGRSTWFYAQQLTA